MNDHATSLKLQNSFFDSPHGLMNQQNVSTAYDMGRLTSICMQNPVFRTIVATKTYQCRGLREVKVPTEPAKTRQNRYENETMAAQPLIEDGDTMYS